MNGLEYRVMWRGRESSLSLQLGKIETSKVMAEMRARCSPCAGLRAEGCLIWIESRPVGPWMPCTVPA